MKRILLVALLWTMLAAPVWAAFQGPVAGAVAQTVREALDCKDDAPVTLTGNIVARKAGSDDKYLFKDASGELTVDIDGKVFAGRTVNPEHRVRLSGKVDKDLFKAVKVKVKVLEILD